MGKFEFGLYSNEAFRKTAISPTFPISGKCLKLLVCHLQSPRPYVCCRRLGLASFSVPAHLWACLLQVADPSMARVRLLSDHPGCPHARSFRAMGKNETGWWYSRAPHPAKGTSSPTCNCTLEVAIGSMSPMHTHSSMHAHLRQQKLHLGQCPGVLQPIQSLWEWGKSGTP